MTSAGPASAERSEAGIAERAILVAAIIAVPLSVSSSIGDPFTSVKWRSFAALALGSIFAAAVSSKCRMPLPSRRVPALAIVALMAFTLTNGLRFGIDRSLEPLLARLTFVGGALCAHGVFSRNQLDTRSFARGLMVPLTIVVFVGLMQVVGLTRAWGLEPLFGLAGSDGRSATFGNVNMAAQFVGFGVVFLFAHAATDATRRSRAFTAGCGALLVIAVAYLIASGARSALLATIAGVAATLLLTGRPFSTRTAHRTAALAAAVVLTTAIAWAAGAPNPFATALKAESLRLRWALWSRTAELIADHPFGVGSGNFLHAFLPYQLSDARLRSETVVYTTPHNELLRALAEEGVGWTALAGYLLLRLAGTVRRRARAQGWPPVAVVLTAGAAFLAVESAFQFPFALAFGSLAAATLLGLALSFVTAAAPDDRARATPPAWPLRAALVTLAAAGLFVLARVACSDWLTARAPADAIAQAKACELNPRNLRACLQAAWLHAGEGDRARARVQLAAILDRSPHYFPAIRLLADEAFAQGDARAGCFYAWLYDRLFDGRTAVHQMVAARCAPELLNAFAAQVQVPGYARFPLTVPAGGDP